MAVPFDQVAEATSPRYPISREGCVIDLTTVEDGGVGFLPVATETISERMRRFLDQGGEARKASHISVFALAPMPLLVYLGRQLTNKIPCDVFQRHRDTEDWTWKADGTSVQYLVRQVREGKRDRAALVLSLSGTVPLEHLPAGAAEASAQDAFERLEMDLREQILSLDAQPGRLSRYGQKYEILGALTGPNGHTAWVRTIWIILTGETAPRLVTLIPAVKP